ncbi:MAG: hypothetical protein GX111_06505 [Clostridiales bacterium]|nr:hypothetical protein [Clostridiales bacterium]
MKKNLRLISVMTALSLLFAIVSGCGAAKNPDNTPQISVSPSALVTETPDQTPTASPEPSPAFLSDTLMMTVSGMAVYWDEMKYWMFDILQNSGLDMTESIDWSQTVEGIPMPDYLISEAVNAISLFRLVELKCSELGVGLKDEDRASMDTFREDCIAQFQSESEYEAYLDQSNLTQELLEYMNMVAFLYNNLFVEMYGVYGEKLSNEDAVSFGNENGFFRAKHILISDLDEEGNALSEENIAANYDKLLGLLDQLNASDNPAALFDELMNTYSEDPGLLAYPNGYQYVSGIMDPSFQSAVESLSDYGISDIVKMPTYGYTIIMRLPLNPNEPIFADQNGSTLRYIASATRFQTQLDAWLQEMDIQYAPAFEQLNPEDWF